METYYETGQAAIARRLALLDTHPGEARTTEGAAPHRSLVAWSAPRAPPDFAPWRATWSGGGGVTGAR